MNHHTLAPAPTRAYAPADEFDTIIDRRGSGALKTDGLRGLFGRADLTPLWVADMDFPTPEPIVRAVEERLRPPVLGYPAETPAYKETVAVWVSRHGEEADPAAISYIPGVVKGIGAAIQAFSHEGDGVIIQPPVYPPFRLTVELGGRRLLPNPLRERPGGGYEMDFEKLEELAKEARMLILCSPHNPSGTVWSEETLRRVARICSANGVTVVSDEIHCDMPLFGARHRMFTSVSGEARSCGVVLGAPSKTFNMAGIVSSWAYVPDERLRRRFFTYLRANGLDEPNMFVGAATIAALTHCDGWRRRMLRYVEGNVALVEETCLAELPQVHPWRPQASFLVWLDCRDLGLPQSRLVDLFVNRARLALNDGATFGAGGTGFMRLNVGAPRALIAGALRSLRRALAGDAG